MKLLFLLLVCASLFGKIGDHASSIVFVHIGKTMPAYLVTAVKQAHLFNPNSDLIVIANKEAIQKEGSKYPSYLNFVACESLKQSWHHYQFLNQSKLDRSFRNGFWLRASERFFVLDELVNTYQLKDVFHLESDCMLYADLQQFLPVLHAHYTGIAAPFEDGTLCIPCLVYVPNGASITELAKFMVGFSRKIIVNKYTISDMFALGTFMKEAGKGKLDSLPVVIPEYLAQYPFKPEERRGLEGASATLLCNHVENFGSVFDGAGYGQYLGGQDPRNGICAPGYVSPYAIVNRSHMEYIWERDQQNRKIPYLLFQNKKIRINNLHIHSKKLEQFSS
jgi:hypothetical protein